MQNDKLDCHVAIAPRNDFSFCHCEPKAKQSRKISYPLVILSLLLFISAGCSKGPEALKLIVRHIENKDFAEEHVVKIRDEFFISDTEYSAKVIKFIPDFVMNEKTKRVSSRSKKPNNPAVLVRVYHKGRFLYDSWVLQKADTIHYVRKPGFYFEFKEYSSPLVGERGTHASSMGRVRGVNWRLR